MMNNHPLPINYLEWNVTKNQAFMAGTGYSVAFIIALLNRSGWTAEDVATDYDLTLAQIYAACSYYHDHREEIETILNQTIEGGRPLSELAGYQDFITAKT